MTCVQIRYYTDPACPWSWALEPSLRRLQTEFGDALQFEYVMAGMGDALQDGPHMALQALEAADRSGMPVDVRIWLRDPPTSSQAAGMAVKAASEQGDPGPYLRRLREGFFCRGRRLDNLEALLAEARQLPAIDLERFRIALSSDGVLELLGEDLERARRVASEHHSETEGRVVLPSLEFCGADGAVNGVYGYGPYDELRQAALAAGAVSGALSVDVDQALQRFGVLSTAEVSTLCRLPGPTAAATLWQLAAEWRVSPERCGGGELWTLAQTG